jgi:hypothetical protein
MHATDGTLSRHVLPGGRGVRRGSTHPGHKERALPGPREPQRGNGCVPAALPQDRPLVVTRSLLSSGSDQGRSSKPRSRESSRRD